MCIRDRAVSEKELQELVRSVLARMGDLTPSQQEETGVYDKMEDAIAASARAQKEIRRMPLEFREKIIANIRKLTMENLQKLAEMGVAETGMGNVGHKIIKHQLVAEKTPGTEDLSTIAGSGDRGLTLVEQGPFGVIGAITPVSDTHLDVYKRQVPYRVCVHSRQRAVHAEAAHHRRLHAYLRYTHRSI